jgi:hypothetical protein
MSWSGPYPEGYGDKPPEQTPAVIERDQIGGTVPPYTQPVGPQGPAGSQGPQGDTGTQGPRGYQGYQGA